MFTSAEYVGLGIDDGDIGCALQLVNHAQLLEVGCICRDTVTKEHLELDLELYVSIKSMLVICHYR